MAAATDEGKALGCLAMSVDDAKRWIDKGFRMIAFGGDLWLYQAALKAGAKSEGKGFDRLTLSAVRSP